MVKEKLKNVIEDKSTVFGFTTTKMVDDMRYKFVKVNIEYLKKIIKILEILGMEEIFVGVESGKSPLIFKKELDGKIALAIAPIYGVD